MKEITVEAITDNIGIVTDFVDEFLDAYDCSFKAKMQIDIAIDEIFSNISHYAYEEVGETVTVRLEILEESKTVSITFIDRGIQYNPLTNKDPDTTLSAEERELGGLGIYMVKKNMDEVSYTYLDGENHFTMKKRI